MKKIIVFLALLLAFGLLFTACKQDSNTTATTSQDSSDSTEDKGTTIDQTTVETEQTTAETTDRKEETTEVKEKDPATLLAEHKYAKAGQKLVLETCVRYYDLKNHELRTYLGKNDIATVWPLASYIEMLTEAYRLYPDNERIEKYYRDVLDYCLPTYEVKNATIKPPSGQVYTNITYYNAGRRSQGDFYYDDNAWVCIQLINAYELLGEEKYFEQAQKILEFMWTGWDDVQGGGIYWDKTFQGKGICCNGPVAVAYLKAYRYTQNETYLERAKMIYDWANSKLRDKNGIYHAGLDLKTGSLDPWKSSYDQGTMMTSAALLYEFTKDEKYLNDLKQTAQSTINLMFEVVKKDVKMKGNPIFKSWCVGWAVRGEMTAVDYTDQSKLFMKYLKMVLDKTLETKDKNGQYDPYFCTGEWWDGEEFDNDVIQPTGVATILLLTGYHDVYQLGQNKSYK